MVEVGRKAYLASIVPVIVNAVLNEHQLIIDIVAFVSKGDFPRSRLGEKQRGKILASWVTRKMRTIAQFGIRDADGADSQITEVAEPRSGVGSVVGIGSSLRNVETVTTPQAHPTRDYMSVSQGMKEMPEPYESSIVESPPLPLGKDDDRDDTPTGAPNSNHLQAVDGRYRSNSSNAPQLVTDYFPPQGPNEPHSASGYSPQDRNSNISNGYNYSPTDRPDAGPDFEFNASSAPPPPRFDSKPTLQGDRGNGADSRGNNDLYSLPSQSRQQSRDVSGSSGRGGGGGGGLRVANADDNSDGGDDNSWPQEAIMHMNLARGENRKGSGRYDGSGYGAAM